VPSISPSRVRLPSTSVHVAAAIEEPDLRVVPPAIVVVADVQRHVKVFDEVNEEP
jgi:hypothetical protein